MGISIGPYHVLGRIGAGGMGEVYRASDNRLGRDVALKVLLEGHRGDPDRLRRFESEARVVAAVTHPNIVAIHDVGVHDGAPYLVTELLEGETLRERLERGPLPPRKAVDVASQVARGLAAAHDKGIVHRDLKPENVFLTAEGRVKILDFGVAKALRAGSEELPDGGLATLAETATGVVVGTAGYMAPEQVRGRPADHRSDIFALGAVVYEMLTGRHAFAGDTMVERGYAVLNVDPPDLAELDGVPPFLARVVARCLDKDPGARFQSARDLVFALDAADVTSTVERRVGTGPQPPVRSSSLRSKVLVGVALATITGAAALTAAKAGSPDADRLPELPRVPSVAAVHASSRGGVGAEPVRFQRMTFRRGWVSRARFAPDGSTVVYSMAAADEPPQVLASVPGMPGGRSLAATGSFLFGVSSGGELALGIGVGGEHPDEPKSLVLARAPMSGGAPRQLVKGVMDADWGPGGDDLMVVRKVDGEIRLEYPVGKVLYKPKGWISNARVSPDGKRVAFLEYPIPNDDRGDLRIVDLEGNSTVLSARWWTAQGVAWSPDGREVWFSGAREGTDRELYAVSLDGVERSVLRTPGSVRIHDIAADGRVLLTREDHRMRIASVAGGQAPRDLSWFDGSLPVALTADGKELLFIEGLAAATPEVSAYLRPTDGGSAVRLGTGYARGLSPDGEWALISPTPPFGSLRLVPTGPGEERDLRQGTIENLFRVHWFADGKRILIFGKDAEGPRLWVQDLEDPEAEPEAITDVGTQTMAPPSPDGKRIVVVKEGSVSLLDLATGKMTKLALPPATFPIAWSADGKTLFVAVSGKSKTRAEVSVARYTLASGKLERIETFAPADSAGVVAIGDVLVSPDGQLRVYGYTQHLSDLYVVEGLQ